MRRLHAWLVRLGIVGRRDGCRDRFRSPAIGAASRDVRFGLRLLRRQPGFALIAITTLALGIGANTAVFAVVDAVLLRPLPYATPERIVEITGPGQGFVRMGPFDIQPPALRDSPAFVAMGVYLAGAVSLGGAPSVRVPAAAVSQGFFDVLGVPPAIGRTFTTADAKASGRIVVLGDRLWRERYRSDPSIVGQSIVIDGSPFVIFGVMPPGVSFPANASLWVPTSAPSGVKGYIPLAKVIARLADGVPDASVRGEVIRLAGNRVTDPTAVQVLPMREALVGGVRPMAVS